MEKITTFGKSKIIFFPKIRPSNPVAKRDLSNKIITNPIQLKKLYAKHFQHRMRKRPMLSELKNYEQAVQTKFSEVLSLTNKNKFPDWNMKNLEDVLKSLKRSQSQDSMGLVNELFMLGYIGHDLKLSLLQLFNKIKNTTKIPDFFKNVYITAIPKKKKSPLDLSSLRGIFLVPKLKVVFMKLVYNSVINIIEDNLSLSNIGARKKKSPRDHLFVVYSVIHETLKENDVCDRDLVFYDLAQAYDSLWLEHTLLDLYENKVESNLLNVIHESSRKASIAIKTPVGISESK